MGTNKKPRKKYKPKPVVTDPLGFVIEGMKTASESKQVIIKARLHLAMKMLTTGQGTSMDWTLVSDALNISLALARDYPDMGEDHIPDLVLAQKAMLAVKDRYKAGTSFVFKALEMASVNYGIQLHDEQFCVATVKQWEGALAIVEAELRAGKFAKRD